MPHKSVIIKDQVQLRYRARIVIRRRCSSACAKPLRRRQVLRTSRLRAETHFGVQARNRRTLNQTGFVAITLTPLHPPLI